MKLYGNPVLPFSRLVETVAQFTKTEYDFQMVDLFSGKSQKNVGFIRDQGTARTRGSSNERVPSNNFWTQKGEHRSEWYETMNPKHQIPCAQFKDGFLADSVVISKYLCKMNRSNLYPENAMKQAKIDEAIIDVTEPNFKFRYFSRFDPLPSAGP